MDKNKEKSEAKNSSNEAKNSSNEAKNSSNEAKNINIRHHQILHSLLSI